MDEQQQEFTEACNQRQQIARLAHLALFGLALAQLFRPGNDGLTANRAVAMSANLHKHATKSNTQQSCGSL